MNQPGKPYFWEPAPDQTAVWLVDAYHGTAPALRRDLFCQLGGYRANFFHQVEETDYCMRLLNAGFVTRLSSANPILHYESPKRDRSRIFTYDTRNRILVAWYDVPAPYIFIHLPGTILQAIRHGTKHGYMWASLRGTIMGLATIATQLHKRRPVCRQSYRLSRYLRKHAPVRLDAVVHRLPIDSISLGSRHSGNLDTETSQAQAN